MVERVLTDHGRIDGLVNNAGGQYRAPLKTISTKGFEAVYLLSPAASYITGSCIRIDGGAPNARRGWWDLQPAKNNVAFDGFHRSSLPKILDEGP